MYHPRRDDSAHRAAVLALKGSAVHTALIGRILLMRSYHDAVERTVILFAVVVLAVAHGAVDTMVRGIVVKHVFHLKSYCRCSDNDSIFNYGFGIHIIRFF